MTAHLENKPGRLAKICEALAHEKVNIRALTVMDSGDRSVLRFVVDQVEPALKILTSLGTESTSCDVLAVEIENRPGSLTRVLEKLASEHINIEYAYVSAASANGRSLGIFHTSNPKRALQVLHESAQKASENTTRRPLHSR